MLFFKGDNLRVERSTEPFVQESYHLIAWPSAQGIKELFGYLPSIFGHGVRPGTVMKRHGVGQGAIAIENVSCVPFFGRSKNCHSENGDSCTCSNRVQMVPRKAGGAEFLLILDAFPG